MWLEHTKISASSSLEDVNALRKLKKALDGSRSLFGCAVFYVSLDVVVRGRLVQEEHSSEAGGCLKKKPREK